MTQSDQQLLSSGFNTAIMVAFALPGGPVIAAGLAATQFFLPFLFPAAPPPPKEPPITHADLQKALDDLKTEVFNIVWKDKADTINAKILTLNKGFQDFWVKNLPKAQVDHGSYTVTSGGLLDQDFVPNTKKYFTLEGDGTTLAQLRDLCNDLEISTNNGEIDAVRTVGLYGFLGCLTAAYLNAAVVWTWGQEILAVNQYAKYKDAVVAFHKGDNTFESLAALEAYYAPASDPKYSPKDWEGYKQETYCPVDTLKDEMQKLLDHCATVLGVNGGPARIGLWDRIHEPLKAVDEQYSCEPVLEANKGISKEQIIAAVEMGTQRAGNWDTLVANYAADRKKTLDDIAEFKKAMDMWRVVQANVSYSTHLVKNGETLLSIAGGDLAVAKAIVDMNQDRLVNSDGSMNPPAAGMTLKIFDWDAYLVLREQNA